MTAKSRSAWLPTCSLLVILALPPTGHATELLIDGAENAIFGGEYAHFHLEEGITALEVSVAGTAYCAPDRPFDAILAVYHCAPDHLRHVAIGEDSDLVIDDLRPGYGAIDFFFVDDDPSDNSGSYVVSVTPDAGPPFDDVVVSARDHAIDVSRAVTTVLPAGCLLAEANGDAWWAHYGQHPDSGHYVNVVLMYDDLSTPSQRVFVTVDIEGDVTELAGYAGDTLWAFVTDVSGIVFDNGGQVTVTLESGPSPAHTVSWGMIKSLLRRNR